VIKAGRTTIAGYAQRVKDAGAFGDNGPVVQRKDMVRNETTDVEGTARILCGWSP
jgi:hypothetical protein